MNTEKLIIFNYNNMNNKKINCESLYTDNSNIIYGLFHRDNLNEKIMCISYSFELLSIYKIIFFNELESNSIWIEQIDLFLISKISLFQQFMLILKCSYQTENKFSLNKINHLKKNINNKFYCFESEEVVQNDKIYTKQKLIIIDSSKIKFKSINELIKYFKGLITTHEIMLDKFYLKSIKTDNFIFNELNLQFR